MVRWICFQILWTFSIYLESVAILPQLFMISKTGEAESITSHYLFALGSYRALYILNWIYRYYFEGFFDLIAVVAGCVQTVLYCDFFYLYITKGMFHSCLPVSGSHCSSLEKVELWSKVFVTVLRSRHVWHALVLPSIF